MMDKRKYLTSDEIEKLMKATAKTRHPLRNKTIILMLYRHGLRVSELCSLMWSDVNLETQKIYIKRAKGSKSGTHPLYAEELRYLKKLKKQNNHSSYIFLSQSKTPLPRNSIQKILKTLSELTDLGFNCHPHQLRHGCGYYLANKGVDTRTIQEYLGHKNIQNTVIYTELTDNRFRKLWD